MHKTLYSILRGKASAPPLSTPAGAHEDTVKSNYPAYRGVGLGLRSSNHRVTHLDSCPLLTHGMLSSSTPSQDLPPCCGAGAEQVRDLVSRPSPQSAEHGVHSLQTDHWPLTVNHSHNPPSYTIPFD